MFRSVHHLLLLLTLLIGTTGLSAEPGSVKGVGTTKLTKLPSVMRMTITLPTKGNTTKEALAKLSDRREAVKIMLKTLEADENSVSFGDPSIVPMKDEQQQQMAMMIESRMARGARVPKGLQIPKSVTVSCTLTAEWPLSYANVEELLLVTSELQDRIESADLAGLKEPKKLTPEQEELEEEMASMRSRYGYSNSEQTPGKPKFSYVANISDEDRAAALAKAFSKAKLQATQTAAAAGAELGELSEITSQLSHESEDEYYEYRMRGSLGTASENPNEASGVVAGPVAFQFNIEASFHLK